jgi:hypothetical protein
MADTTDTGGWARYPSMTPPAEAERPAAPSDAGRYPSMPGGAVPARRVPRHPPATTAAAAATAADPEAAQLRARYPTMAEAGIRPTEADAAPVAEGEPAAQDPVPSSAAPVEVPAEYQNLRLPDGYELQADAFAPAAQAMREAGLDPRQAEAMIATYATLQEREDAVLAEEQKRWRAEVERTLTPSDRQAVAAVMRGAPAEVRGLLDRSGFADHPVLARWFATLGKRLGGVAASADPRSRYPSMNTEEWR